ncbi:hypothetical protein SEA_ATUIN_203 [Arthrobacter phage Atuin]|nr:hypothetical protein SEA_ATUIN_2 [Arthrobacter phage Atuin]
MLREGQDASELAGYISEHYFKSSEYHYRISDAIPENVDANLSRVTKQTLDSDPTAKVLLFFPFKDKSIVAEKARNGQIPR